MYTYPPFPNLNSGIGTFLIQLIEWIIEVPLVAIANFVIGIESSAQTGASNSIGAVFGFIGVTWDNSVASFQQFGVLAPIIAGIIWGTALLILIFFVGKAIELTIREVEND